MSGPAQPTIHVVDDHEHMRSALRRVLVRAGFAVELHASGSDFLAAANLDAGSCILLDISMPGMTGLEVQAQLRQRRTKLPVVFLTGTADIPIAVAAMREGAADFIEKPFDNDDLVARVRKAIALNARQPAAPAAQRSDVLRGLESLTPREREVMELVVAGRTSKEIARIIGASHRTVEIHRSRLMRKMGAATVADLVRMRVRLMDVSFV